MCSSPRYIVVSPADLGTGLRASVMMRLPKLSTRADFKQICAGMKLSAVGDGSGSGVFDISNVDRLGVSEVDLANAMIVGCAKLVKMEQAAEEGVPMWDMIPGLGDAPTAGFPWKETPASMPDLSAHQSTVAKVLKRNGCREIRSFRSIPLRGDSHQKPSKTTSSRLTGNLNQKPSHTQIKQQSSCFNSDLPESTMTYGLDRNFGCPLIVFSIFLEDSCARTLKCVNN